MRAHKLIPILILIVGSSIIAAGLFSNKLITYSQHEITYGKNDTYDDLWKKVDSCQNKGLTESALKVVDIIYTKAKKENNAPQFVKAIIHRMKFANVKEEFYLEKSIAKLNTEVKESKFPIKPILQSILADAYWQYFQNNRWKFYNRTTTVNFKNDDVSTWDLKTITYATIANYKASLENADSLKRTKVNIYDQILIKGNKESREWRPTLYDFLAHRALTYFINTEPDVSRPATRFSVNDPEYLKPYSDFINLNITNPSDSLETKFYALLLMQDLTKFHSKDENKSALIDIELKRIDFIYGQASIANKDTLYFNTLKALQSKFNTNERVSEIDYKIGAWYLSKSYKYKPLEGDNYKWYKKTAKELFEATIKKHPKTYGAIQCENAISDINSKTYNINIEEVNEPNKPFRALVTSKNVNKLYFKVVKTSHFELRKVYRNRYGKDLLDKFKAMPVVQTYSQTITDDGDYNTHNTEIKLPELTTGYYIILSSLTPDFNYGNNITAYTNCIISDIASIERNKEDGSIDFYTMHRQTGEPLQNVSAQIWFEQYDYKDSEYKFIEGPKYKTDSKGYLNIDKDEIDQRTFYVEFKKDKDTYFNTNAYYTYKPFINNEARIQSHIFTDRAIYRPGQTVYFKSIVLESSNNQNPVIKSNQPVTVSLYDVNHQLVQSLNLTTNEFGSVSGSFTAPQNGLNGQMRISDGYSNIYVSVEDYKRPKFETKINPVTGSFKLNDEVKVSGYAKAFAGNLIDGAKVTYRVIRKTNYPYWYWWYRPYNAGNSDVEITNGETTTNDTGTYFINFKAIADVALNKESNAYYSFEIKADVTDINGETHSTQSYVNVGYQAINLNISCDDIISQSKIEPIEITTNNLNGVLEPTKGSITIHKLKQPSKVFRNRLWEQPDRQSLSQEEYYKTFPNDLYADENNKYKWPKEQKVLEKQFNTGTQTKYDLSTDLKTLKPGVYVIEANCTDKYGESVKAFKYVTIFNTNHTEVPEKVANWFYCEKTIGEPGDKINFILASGYPNVNYLYELEQQNEASTQKTMTASMQTNSVLIEEKHRGNFAFHTSFIKFNRFYRNSEIIVVPYTNKELDIQFATYRDKLLPGQNEEWKLILKDKKGEKAAAELLTGMYDASLDAFKANNWYFNIYKSFYSRLNWTNSTARVNSSSEFNNMPYPYKQLPNRTYDELNYFGLVFYNRYYYEYEAYESDAVLSEVTIAEAPRKKSEAKPAAAAMSGAVMTKEDANGDKDDRKTVSANTKNSLQDETTRNENTDNNGGDVKVRSNFNETAFFFPQLQTNELGEVVIKFTVPESLTKWKLLGLAHTKDLKYGQFQKEIITQKELMVQPNAPRFFRENDQITFISKVVNLSEKDLNGKVELKLFDALTETDITTQLCNNNTLQNFNIKKGLSTAMEWNLKIPEGYSAIKYKLIAKADNFSDGEEMAIPVLTNRMLVTESMPMPIRSNQTKTFNFTKFTNQNNQSKTLKNHSYTLEFTANPAWYAVQALPYIMEYPYECAEQTFARYYANSLATYVINSKPKIKAVFDSWKTASPDAFLSNLEKNQELKAVVLEETPWVLQAKNETENKKRIGLLFDLNKMSYEQQQAFKKLLKKQSSNGGFMWFDGMPDDWYITQHIASGFGHLDKLGVINRKNNSDISNMLYKAVKYCDNKLRQEFEAVKKHSPKYKDENHLDYMAIQYLYMRSNYKDIGIDNVNKDAVEYYKKQAQKYWLQTGRYMQGMIALSLNRYDDSKTAKDILRSLKENSLNSEEMGMYWKENYGYYWYQAPIEMQALMIEAFDEINNDTQAVDDLKTWLVKSKQTQHWGTTRATTEAVYALLLKGTDWLSTEPNVTVTVGNIKLDPKTDKNINAEPGTGYFKKVWHSSDINPNNMGTVKVEKKDVGVSYGAMYWQYFEQLDKITPHETPLKLKKQLFLQKNTASGVVIEPITADTKLKLGDKIKVRIELRVDRDMSYVHMKDMRASGFEPTNVFSGYRYQDGLGYYESTRDAATNFFFSYLNKGTYVFEYPLVVNHYGDFSNGITSIQCMYAPEFTSHSEGIRVKVVK